LLKFIGLLNKKLYWKEAIAMRDAFVEFLTFAQNFKGLEYQANETETRLYQKITDSMKAMG